MPTARPPGARRPVRGSATRLETITRRVKIFLPFACQCSKTRSTADLNSKKAKRSPHGTTSGLNPETVGLENPASHCAFSSSSTTKILFTIGIFCLNAATLAPYAREPKATPERRKYSLKTRAGATKTGIRLFIKEIVLLSTRLAHSWQRAMCKNYRTQEKFADSAEERLRAPARSDGSSRADRSGSPVCQWSGPEPPEFSPQARSRRRPRGPTRGLGIFGTA